MNAPRDSIAALAVHLAQRIAWERELGAPGWPGTLPAPLLTRQPAAAKTAQKTDAPSTERRLPDAPPPALPKASEKRPVRPPGETAARALQDAVAACRRCPLHQSRSAPIVGDGPDDAPVMFVGPAPTAEEDAVNMPFVGDAGTLFHRMLSAMGLRRDAVYVCHVAKCAPPPGTKPRVEWLQACLTHLEAQVRRMRPAAIVAFGGLTLRALCGHVASFGEAQGTWHTFLDVPVMPVHHPATLLRHPEHKRAAWHALQQVVRRLQP